MVSCRLFVSLGDRGGVLGNRYSGSVSLPVSDTTPTTRLVFIKTDSFERNKNTVSTAIDYIPTLKS